MCKIGAYPLRELNCDIVVVIVIKEYILIQQCRSLKCVWMVSSKITILNLDNGVKKRLRTQAIDVVLE